MVKVETERDIGRALVTIGLAVVGSVGANMAVNLTSFDTIDLNIANNRKAIAKHQDILESLPPIHYRRLQEERYDTLRESIRRHELRPHNP